MFDELMKIMDAGLESTLSGSSDITLVGNEATESAIVLTALRSRTTKDEFVQIATEASTEMDLYNVVESEDTVSDTVAEVAKDDMPPEAAFAALQLAKDNADEDAEKYEKFAALAAAYRKKIEEKYKDQAIQESALIISNAAKKAAYIKSDAGKKIVDILSK